MIRSIFPLRSLARMAVLLPVAVLGTGCSGSDEDDATRLSSAGAGGARSGETVATAGSGGAQSQSGSAGTAGTSAAAGGSSAVDEPIGDGGSGPLDGGESSGPDPVELGGAGDYAVLAQSAISNVPPSVITGSLGLSPAAASYVTGFTLTRAGMMWTSPEISGGVFAADNDPTTPADLTAAVADMGAAYDDAAGRVSPEFENLGDGAIGGLTLAPGLYKWTSTVTIPTDVVLAGAADDTWIFQISGDLTMSAGQRMNLSGGARAQNIVWQVAGEIELGATAHAEGVLLSKTAIHIGTGGSVNGRLLSQTAVTLASSTVTAPGN